MFRLMGLFFSLLCVVTFSTEASAKECRGCRCKNECWSTGECQVVCRDSCGQFCFADEPLIYTPLSAGVNPTGYTCPSSHPIKGNTSTYDKSKCIAHRPGGGSYRKTHPERCYATMEDAIADGCRPAKR